MTVLVFIYLAFSSLNDANISHSVFPLPNTRSQTMPHRSRLTSELDKVLGEDHANVSTPNGRVRTSSSERKFTNGQHKTGTLPQPPRTTAAGGSNHARGAARGVGSSRGRVGRPGGARGRGRGRGGGRDRGRDHAPPPPPSTNEHQGFQASVSTLPIREDEF